MLLSKLTDKKLIEIVKESHDSICVADCFGTSDLKAYYGGMAELEKRGYKVKIGQVISISK